MKKVEIKKENEEEEEREREKERESRFFFTGKGEVSAISKAERENTKGVRFKQHENSKYENTKTRNEIKLTSSSESCPKRGIAVWLTSIISTFKSGRRTKDQQISSEQIRSDQRLFSAIHVASCVCVCV